MPIERLGWVIPARGSVPVRAPEGEREMKILHVDLMMGEWGSGWKGAGSVFSLQVPAGDGKALGGDRKASRAKPPE